MLRAFIRHVILFGCALFVFASACGSAALQSRILQYRLDRLYFAAGKEANVFAGSPFVIVCNGDSVYKGCIEESFIGASYSDTIGLFFDTLSVDSCYVVIDAADVDSLSPIKLGAVRFEPLAMLTDFLGTVRPLLMSIWERNNPITVTGIHGNEVSITQHAPFIDMMVSLQFGEIDGFFSYKSYSSQMEDRRVIDTAAPFFVALVPNLSRKVNRSGLITTSLYYRFGGSRLPLVFDGDEVHPMNCLYSAAGNCRRPYPYDPEKGRGLLEHYSQRPRVLRISVMNKSLEKLALYFADVLSRDRIDVELQRSFEDADIYLTFIPVDDRDPLVALRHIQSMLLPSQLENFPQHEVLFTISNNLTMAENEGDRDRRAHYCRLAEQSLMYDLGLFPLFRPRIFFHASESLKNYRFDSNGFLDLEALTKLKLPSPEQRCNQ